MSGISLPFLSSTLTGRSTNSVPERNTAMGSSSWFCGGGCWAGICGTQKRKAAASRGSRIVMPLKLLRRRIVPQSPARRDLSQALGLHQLDLNAAELAVTILVFG